MKYWTTILDVINTIQKERVLADPKSELEVGVGCKCKKNNTNVVGKRFVDDEMEKK